MAKKLPYSLRLMGVVLGMAGLTLIPGCKNDDEPKGPVDNTPHHNTTYTFGYDAYDNIFDFSTGKPITHPWIAASADSASVDTVFLKADVNKYGISNSWFLLFTDTEIKEAIIDRVLNSVGEKNRHKIRGTGTLVNVAKDTTDNRQWLKDFGFEFKAVYDNWATTYSKSNQR